MRTLLDYLVLPKEISPFEASFLARTNRIALWFFFLHLPAFALLAWLNGTGSWASAILTMAVLVGPTVAHFTVKNPRTVSLTYGVAAMSMGGLLVHFGQGPLQIEMHFYFFSLLAMLAIFGNPMVIVIAAATVTLHHLLLWFVVPRSVFNYDAPLWVVAVHAAFVVFESVAACYIARSFFDNVIGLEKIVQSRTKELDARTRDMRLVLDNVVHGLVTIDAQALLISERSAALEAWFGEPRDGETLFDLFERLAPAFAARSREGWDEVTAGIMPLELTLEQMPRILVAGDRHLSVHYSPIGDDLSPSRFLLVVADVSAEVARRRAEQGHREAMQLLERLLSDRNAFRDFFEEASALVVAIVRGPAAADVSGWRRMVHTLKGNAGLFGLDSIADICHSLETELDERASAAPSTLSELASKWEALSGDIHKLLGGGTRVLEIDAFEQAAMESAVRRGTSREELLPMVHAMRLEDTGRRLEVFADQARRIAARLGKGDIVVTVESNALRVDPIHWNRFWSSFVHAVRNAVGHGIETPGARMAAGKSAVGTIALRALRQGDRFVIEIHDDGRGIDWKKLADKAGERGLPAATRGDLEAVLFHDGVSTSREVTDLAGRGMGMGALLEATEALGGVIVLITEEGLGTTLRMTFPARAMSPSFEMAVSAGESPRRSLPPRAA